MRVCIYMCIYILYIYIFDKFIPFKTILRTKIYELVLVRARVFVL